jgi:DNA adenine methylase
MLTPLRYPGSKADFVGTIHKIIQHAKLEDRHFFEPYAGSAAISLALVDAGTVRSATLVERDPLVFSFWYSLFNHTDDLICMFQELPINLETWHKLRPLLQVDKIDYAKVVNLGLAGLFFNRANFSGVMNAGPIGGQGQKSEYKIDCRTNKDDLIGRMLAIASLADRFTVEFGDAVEFMSRFKNRKNVLFYIDPPYFEKGESLYRYFYRHADHKKLAIVLKKSKFPWILSYDPHHVIEFLYSDFEVQKHLFRYSVRSPKKHDELLISNIELPKRW